MKISVVIPTYNRCGLMALTIPTVLDQDFPSDDYEIIVVVDGSRDGTADRLRPFAAHRRLIVLEDEHNCGPGHAKNLGVAAARGELVLFLDDDLLCERTLLAAHANAHRNAPPQLVVGPVLLSPASRRELSTELEVGILEDWLRRLANAHPASWPINLPIGTNVSTPRAEVLRIGGFDENLSRMHEDLDLAYRLRAAGIALRFQAVARTFQVYTKSADIRVLRDAKWAGRNSIVLARKHPALRRYVRQSRLRQGNVAKRLARSVAVRLPLSPEPLLEPAFELCEHYKSIPHIGHLGKKILRARMATAALRSALREAGSWENMRREFGMQASMLVYHHVGRQTPGRYYPGLSLEPARFERQIAWLARHGYSTIRPDQWYAWLVEGKPLPEKPILIAFDDGHADVAKYALPILQRYGLTAVVFVVTRMIGGVSEWDATRGLTARPLMSACQILEWRDRGFEFGSHSRTHPNLTGLTRAALEHEIEGSRYDLGKLLGDRVLSFAYPYGRFNEAVSQVVAQSYALAFGSEPGLNNLSLDAHRLRRTQVTNRDRLIDLWWRARFGWSPVDRVRFRKSNVRGIAQP
jgi:peptidoglycan/xylan/chitin deacetylase (PgdA/CDA1 family)/glycosyltransferase involved in cell wall biosynthesis